MFRVWNGYEAKQINLNSEWWSTPQIESVNVEVEVANYITQDSSDLADLRLAAKAPSKTDGFGK
jgi:hypothetical protein